MRMLTDAQMFLSSYAFLFVLFGLRIDNGTVRWVSFGLAFLGVAIVATFLSATRRLQAYSVTLTRVENRGADVASYLVTYLLPFLVVDPRQLLDYVAYAVFVIVVGVVYTNSDMIYVNPLLYVFRRKVVYIEGDGETRGICIALAIPNIDKQLWVVRVRDSLYVEARGA